MAAKTLCGNSLLICLWIVSNGAVAVAERVPEPPTPAASLERQAVGDPDMAPATRQAHNGPTCGDGSCDPDENCVNCPSDCGECDPPLVEAFTVDSTTVDNPDGTKSCQVKLHLNGLAEKLLAVGNADIETSDPAGFFQHLFGGDTSPSCDLLPAFPGLSQDSYVTLTVNCDDGSDATSVGPDFDSDLFKNAGRVVGSWFILDPTNTQGDPDADGNVLIAQFTIGQEGNVCGHITALVQGDFGLPPLPGNPDANGDGNVGPLDLATLLGNWGPHDPCPPFVFGDLDQDCDVDLFDLVALLDAWGPVGDPVPSNITEVQLSFECPGPGPPCFVEVPTISKWTQAPEEKAGTTLESNVDLQTLAAQPPGETGDGPNAVVADDFRSDGRPITAVRWWGAYLDPAFEPEGKSEIDGWMVSFHADGTDDPADPVPADLLSLYFCPASSVLIETTDITDSAGRDVYDYAANLEDCCLTYSVVDERDLCDGCTCDFNDNGACEQTDLDLMHGCAGEPDWPDVNCNGESDVGDCGIFLCLFGGGSQEACGCPINPVPAGQADAFHEVAGFQYWLDVQAVVGQHFAGPQCTALPTANSADAPFWGWYSSPDGCFDTSATSAVLSPPDPDDWQFEGWTPDQVVDQAFELLTLRATCPADFAGGPQSSPDGEVGPADLASLLANWGPAPKCAPPSFRYKVMDFNTDEDVGPFDLAQLLALWGPCSCNVSSDCPSGVCLGGGDCEPL